MDAVVLDLFGTLVPAPTPEERGRGASRLAAVVGCDTATVEHYFRDMWHVRHDGTLSTLVDLATHLVLPRTGHAAVFSCNAGAVKPDQRFYSRISNELGRVTGSDALCGDGGGDELRGALAAGMAAIAVRRRGPTNALAFGATDWSGHVLDAAEQVPAYLAGRA